MGHLLLSLALLLQMLTSPQRLQVKGCVSNSAIFLEEVCITHLSAMEIQEWVEDILSIMLSGQQQYNVVPLAEKTVTTTLTCEVLASCWACSTHSLGSGIWGAD